MESLIILFLILLNGIFSMSEIALVSSKKVRLEAALKEGKRGAQTAIDLSNAPTRFLSTVQIGITLIGILTGIYSGENITNDLEAWLLQFKVVRPIADGLAVTLVLLGITFFSLVLGELVPKRLGLSNPEGISLQVASIMKLLSRVAYPFVWILTATSDIILRVLNVKGSEQNVTEQEIKAIMEEGKQDGEVQPIEQEILERVFLLGDRKVSSLMTERGKLAMLKTDDTFMSVRQSLTDNLHAIYPVYEGDKDAVVGVVSLKDLFANIDKREIRMSQLLKPAHYLNENTSAYKALENFKTSKVHYGLVTNEYGLVLGLVTLEDILQALVGDVSDFYHEEFSLVRRDDGSWLVDGHYPLAEFLRYVELEDAPEADWINTIGGLILEQLQHIPESGEILKWRGLELEVVDMDNVKIDKVLIRKTVQ